MDPDATLALLLDALRKQDREAAYGPLEDLSDWIAKGGALPKDPRGVPLDEAELILLNAALVTVHRACKERIDVAPALRDQIIRLGMKMALLLPDDDRVAMN